MPRREQRLLRLRGRGEIFRPAVQGGALQTSFLRERLGGFPRAGLALIDELPRGDDVARAVRDGGLREPRCLGFQELVLLGRLFLDGRLRAVVGRNDVRRGHWRFEVFAAREDSSQPVVVARRDGVELVIVTPRARDGETEEAARERVNAVVELVEALGVAVIHRPEGEEAQRRHAFEAVAVFEQVAGNLLLDEAVVGQVVVEGADEPVPIPPALRIEPWLKTVRLILTVACDVQPVPRLPLAVMRAGQQVIHHLRKGGGGLVVHERLHFFRRRRQADQIEVSATNQRPLLRRRRGHEVLLLQLRENEVVHRRARPCFVLHRRRLHGRHRLPRPMLALAFQQFRVRFLCHFGRRGLLRPRRAELHPLDEVGDDVVRELLLGWHLEVGIRVAHGLDEAALVRLAEHERHAGLAALERALARVEIEAGLELLRLVGVTLVTPLREHGANLLLEELHARRVRRRCSGGGVGEDSTTKKRGEAVGHASFRHLSPVLDARKCGDIRLACSSARTVDLQNCSRPARNVWRWANLNRAGARRACPIPGGR